MPGNARTTSLRTRLNLEQLDPLVMLSAATVYQRDFEPTTTAQLAPGVTANWSNTKKSVTPSGRTFLGDFGNTAVTLNLNKLPAHAALTVEADVYVLRSWDGSDTLRKYGPDKFSIKSGSTTLLDTSFSNQPASSPGSQNNKQGYGSPTAQAGDFPAFAGSVEHNTLGYTFYRSSAKQTQQMDAVYHIKYTIPHSAASAGFTFAGSGLQGLSDESWGLDNVKIRAETGSVVSIGPANTTVTERQVASLMLTRVGGNLSQSLETTVEVSGFGIATAAGGSQSSGANGPLIAHAKFAPNETTTELRIEASTTLGLNKPESVLAALSPTPNYLVGGTGAATVKVVPSLSNATQPVSTPAPVNNVAIPVPESDKVIAQAIQEATAEIDADIKDGKWKPSVNPVTGKIDSGSYGK